MTQLPATGASAPPARTRRVGRADRRPLLMATGATLLCATLLSGCGVVKAVETAKTSVEGNRKVVDEFSTKLKSGAATPFAATYVTTGGSPTVVVYAVRPPSDIAFSDTPSGSTSPSVDLVANASGEYSCVPAQDKSASPACQKLDTAGIATQNAVLNFYTPSHWVNFLKGFSLAAGFAGDRVTASTRTVNGFALSCVDFVAPGTPGTSYICSTAQGVLGYVSVADESTKFEIKAFSSSPAAALFALPAGATVTP